MILKKKKYKYKKWKIKYKYKKWNVYEKEVKKFKKMSKNKIYVG